MRRKGWPRPSDGRSRWSASSDLRPLVPPISGVSLIRSTDDVLFYTSISPRFFLDRRTSLYSKQTCSSQYSLCALLASVVTSPNLMEKGAVVETLDAGLKPDSSKWCWECRRRRLVCDCALPVCNKCRASGIVCPGYEDKKPLTWLAPGRVLSRTRKPKGRPARQKGAVERAKDAAPSSSPSARAGLPLTVRASREPTLRDIVMIPRLQLRTSMCDLVEAVEYCKTGPLSTKMFNTEFHPLIRTGRQLGCIPRSCV